MHKELIKQFLLLVGLNIIRMIYYWHLIAITVVVVGVIIAAGFYLAAFAGTLFLLCGIVRPSIAQKNMSYGIWLIRFLPLFILNFLILWGVQSSIVLTAVSIPFIIFIALYIFDSGLRMRRLIALPISISKIVWHSKYITAVITVLVFVSITYVPFIATLVGMPLFVLMYMLVYYQTLYKQFGVYYAAD